MNSILSDINIAKITFYLLSLEYLLNYLFFHFLIINSSVCSVNSNIF